MANFVDTIKNPGSEFVGGTGAGVSEVGILLAKAAKFGVSILVGLATLMIIVASFQLITAHGNEEQVTKAKQTLLWAIGGLVLGILAYSIVTILTSEILNPAAPFGVMPTSTPPTSP